MLATAGTVADCTQAEALLDGIAAEHLLADRGYDTNRVLAAAARARGMVPALPPEGNRKVAREYDRALYQVRHPGGEWIWQVENVASYLAICQICALVLWAKII